MNLIYAAAFLLLALLAVLAGASRAGSWSIERNNPPAGRFLDVKGSSLHFVHLPAPEDPELPPVVFIHGASANLLDQMVPLRPLLEGRAELLFVDRPGLGWSERGSGANGGQSGQAAAISALMVQLGIDRAIIVGHSFGGSVAAAFALEHPEKTKGLVFLSAATHPWPGGATSWYYKLATVPVLGRLFSETITGPAGALRLAAATRCVFAPNPVPDDYLERAEIRLVLRPSTFRANAADVEGLYRFAVANAARYASIEAPTVIISGDADTVVYEEIHSLGLARDIAGAELVWVRNLGHKPDWIAPDLVVAAIEKIGGKAVDLQKVAQTVEARIAGHAYGAGRCFKTQAPSPDPAAG